MKRKKVSFEYDEEGEYNNFNNNNFFTQQSNKKKTTNSKQEKPEWEQHTKGIGSKLLKMMGWAPGQGLGKDNQGINKPIETKLRPKGAGLGTIDEKTHQPKDDFFSFKDDEEPFGFEPISEENAMEEENKAPDWKKSVSKKPKKNYRIPSIQSESQMVIKDMRGEQPRLITNFNELNQKEHITMDFLPELQYNIRLLADLKQADILTLDQQKLKEKDNLKRLVEEKSELEKSLQKEGDSIHRLQQVSQIVNDTQLKVSQKQLSLKEIADVFLHLQTNYMKEYRAHHLHRLASTLVMPLLEEKLATWNPLQDPYNCCQEFSDWQEIMQSASTDPNSYLEEYSLMQTEKEDNIDVYTQLVVDLVLPKIRYSMINEWNVKDPEPAVSLLETWKKLLPDVVLDNIKNQLLIPKLQRAVDEWNPRQEQISIHSWLHPWLPLLGDHLSMFYPTIRQKLSSLLTSWHPSDPSAHLFLSPWKAVFDPQSFETLLNRSIIPKLERVLKEMVIDPRSQKLDIFEWVLAWKDLVPIATLVKIFENEFFPKWHQILISWLSASNPNYQEISMWYLGWKEKFFSQSEFANHERILAQFNHALLLMDSATSGKPIPTTYVPPSAQPPRPIFIPRSKQPEELSLKETLQKFAEDKGYSFLPTSKRHEGKQIYKFGEIFIYFDKELLYKLEEGRWVPASLSELLNQ